MLLSLGIITYDAWFRTIESDCIGQWLIPVQMLIDKQDPTVNATLMCCIPNEAFNCASAVVARSKLLTADKGRVANMMQNVDAHSQSLRAMYI